MIFFRLRNNPQIPTKKRVKDTPKILNKLIGIFSLFYATWAFTPFDQVAVSQPPTKTLCGQRLIWSNGGALPLVLPCGGLVKIPQVFNCPQSVLVGGEAPDRVPVYITFVALPNVSSRCATFGQ